MGLDMWFREDVTRILASALEVQRNSARSVTALDDEYAGDASAGRAAHDLPESQTAGMVRDDPIGLARRV